MSNVHTCTCMVLNNTCECIYTLRKKMHMHSCMRTYATLQKLLCHGSYCELVLSLEPTSCRLPFPPALLPLRRAGRPPAGQMPDLFAKEYVQTHASSWRSRRCSVAHASSDHPRWCGPHPVCLWFTLVHVHGSHPRQKSMFAAIFAGFFEDSICIYVCAYILYICIIHIHKYMHIHIYIYIYIRIRTYISMYACIYIYKFIYTHIYNMHIYVCIHLCIHIWISVYTCIWINVYIYKYIYIYIYIYMYVCTYVYIYIDTACVL